MFYKKLMHEQIANKEVLAMDRVRAFYTLMREQGKYQVRFNKIVAYIGKDEWNQFLDDYHGRKTGGTSLTGQLTVDDDALYKITDGKPATSIPFKLNAEQYELFRYVHNRHYHAYWDDGTERPKRAIDRITEVEWVEEDDCLHVHYDDGEWWHYCQDGTWY